MVRTKGDVVVDNIKIGDILYEFGYGVFIESEVISTPVPERRKDYVYWTWQSRNTLTGEIINYGVSDIYPQYAPNIYTSKINLGYRQI